MTALLGALWSLRSTLLYGVLAVAAVAGWLYVRGLQSEVVRLTADLQTAEAAADANAAAAEVIRRDAERKLAVLAAERDDLAARSAQVVIVKEKISRAPQSEDAPVAPVLCHALDGLWGRPSGDGSVCRAAGGSAQPAGLRPAAAAAAR